MKNHRHQPARTKGATREVAWTRCVTPALCAANPHRQSAHHNIMRVDTCACGATRKTESNYRMVNCGPWEEPI